MTRPDINDVLADNGIEGDDVPEERTSCPAGPNGSKKATVSTALGAVSGSTSAETPGVHGLGLISTSVNGTELVPESTTAVEAAETPEVEVEVQNQGESTENGVTVSVSAGGTALQESIRSIGAGETGTVTIPLTPAPKGTVTLEVNVEPVPGEQVTENNEASYTVEFG